MPAKPEELGAPAARSARDTPAPHARGDLDARGHVARRSVSEVVSDHIRQLVFAGELSEGQRVPQREIAESLGVSAIPVREALVALQGEGVVSIEPNRGAFVNRLDAEVATEQFYVFGRIYGLATRRATERGSQELVDELVELSEQIQAELDVQELMRLSIRFEWLILETGGSKRLRAFFEPLSRIVPGNFYSTIPDSADATRRGVREMAAAILSRQPEAAEHACWRLMDEIGELVARELRDRSPS